MTGPRSGATTAKGAIVRRRDSATRPRAAVGEMLKNNDPASARVTSVSPAMASACVRVRAEKTVVAPGRAPGGTSGRHPEVTGAPVEPLAPEPPLHRTSALKATTARDESMDMSDLSNLLGDVYGDHRSPDAAPVRRELSADQRTPEWSSETQLDQTFEGWVPGESPTRPSDLSAVAAPPAPLSDPVPMPSLAHALAEAPQGTQAGWASGPSVAPVPAMAMAMASVPMAAAGVWQPGDDDIFPMPKGTKKNK